MQQQLILVSRVDLIAGGLGGAIIFTFTKVRVGNSTDFSFWNNAKGIHSSGDTGRSVDLLMDPHDPKKAVVSALYKDSSFENRFLECPDGLEPNASVYVSYESIPKAAPAVFSVLSNSVIPF